MSGKSSLQRLASMTSRSALNLSRSCGPRVLLISPKRVHRDRETLVLHQQICTGIDVGNPCGSFVTNMPQLRREKQPVSTIALVIKSTEKALQGYRIGHASRLRSSEAKQNGGNARRKNPCGFLKALEKHPHHPALSPTLPEDSESGHMTIWLMSPPMNSSTNSASCYSVQRLIGLLIELSLFKPVTTTSGHPSLQPIH